MIPQLLAYIGQTGLSRAPQSTLLIIPCIMFVIFGGILCLIIVGLVKLIKFLGTAGREQKLIRMELSKLADEVHQIRRELKGDSEQ